MNRGRCSCIVKVEYKKKNMEDGFIAPNVFDKTFEELGIVSGANLVIIEMRRQTDFANSDAGEGQEDEMEEMEDEMDEGELGDEG